METKKLPGVEGYRRALRGGRLAALVAAALIAAPAAAAAKDPIEVGVAAALTGFLANYDGQYVTGVKLAVKMINDGGGADGHQINLHILDDASSAATGMTVTNQLLNQYSVVAMLNGLSSAQNIAIEPVLARAKVPQIVFSILPPDPVWAFQVNVPSERAAALQFRYAMEKLHIKKLAVVYSQTPYGQNNAKALNALAEKAGVAVVYSDAIEASVTDMTPQMAKVKDAGADVIIDVLTGSTHIIEAKAAETVGLTIPLMMAADDTPTYIKASETYPPALIVASPSQAYPNIPDPALKSAYENFLTHFKAAGLDPALMSGATFGWDAARVLAQAISQSGATSSDALLAALEKTTLQGTNTLYKYTSTDHSGQRDVPLGQQIARMNGDKVEVLFSGR